MSLKICVLGSGSTGNSIFVSDGSTTLLVDLGLPALREEKYLRFLGADISNVSVLVTHCHSDHISGLDTFCRRHDGVKVYCHAGCYASLAEKLHDARGRLIPEEGDFFVGGFTVSPFAVSHDVPCVGYNVLYGGKKAAIATDLGVVPASTMEELADSDLVILECNHDSELLRANPHYGAALKRRILSDRGHLSNDDCASCVSYLARRGVRQFVLAHLSRENNYPELAFETVRRRLQADGLTGSDVRLEVAAADRMSGLFEIS